jgi:hypothetical protein
MSESASQRAALVDAGFMHRESAEPVEDQNGNLIRQGPAVTAIAGRDNQLRRRLLPLKNTLVLRLERGFHLE